MKDKTMKPFGIRATDETKAKFTELAKKDKRTYSTLFEIWVDREYQKANEQK